MKCENFSSLIRLLRITAWVQRFIRKLKKDTISGQLTAKEMEEAKFMWIVHIQRKHFAKEIHDITKNKSSNIIRQLGLTIDNNGFIRCVGRTEHADVFDHRNLLHVGVAQTLSQIRQKYWIPQGHKLEIHSRTSPLDGWFLRGTSGTLRKAIGKVCLSVEKLRTRLTEVEAVVNSRPLAYIGEDIDSNIVLTPSWFLTLNKHSGIPERIDNDEDPEYKPQLSSTDNLFEIWKKVKNI
ncbi:unnamed protein product [Mytilus edulis]|uniref:Uncharacterized protein n=1 Tax=Mytilus edulis TaxID=6550 RepID=A0A8S3VBD5_MYTED|nr:unnamed protein product [Mytilus edulis]